MQVDTPQAKTAILGRRRKIYPKQDQKKGRKKPKFYYEKKLS
jgi:hypothetical protein